MSPPTACSRVSLVLVLLATAACYTPFSPERVRHEIVRQTRVSPQTSLQVKLGGATMRFIKTVVSKVSGEPVDFGGITRIDLALYEVAPEKPLDFGKMRVWGWDTLVQARDGNRFIMVLVRTNGETLGDLVLVAQDGPKVLYGRLKGKLRRDLPGKLARIMKGSGLEGLQEHLLEATRQGRFEQSPAAPDRPVRPVRPNPAR